MCTVEAPIHVNIKKEIVKASETDTELVLRRFRNTTRLYRNKVTNQAVKIERESTTGKFEEVAPFVSGKRGREVFINGDPEYGVGYTPIFSTVLADVSQVWTAGQVIGLIHDIPTCDELCKRIEREAEETLSGVSALMVPASKL